MKKQDVDGGQNWLMLDLENQGEMFADVIQLIEIHRE